LTTAAQRDERVLCGPVPRAAQRVGGIFMPSDRHLIDPVRGMSRRQLLGAAGLATFGLGSAAMDAGAARGWCRTDPLILINGELADIFITAPLSMLFLATGPTEYVVTLPKGVRGVLILAGPGFLKGETLRFEHSDKLEKTRKGIEIKVAARVPAKKDLEIGLEFAPRILGILNPDRAEGYTNSWVSLKTVF
jgi:hypothetical protein